LDWAPSRKLGADATSEVTALMNKKKKATHSEVFYVLKTPNPLFPVSVNRWEGSSVWLGFI